MAIRERDISEIKYHSNSCGDFFHPRNVLERITESDLPYELQVMYHKYWWENICNSNAYLVSIPKEVNKNKTKYGILLVYEYSYDYELDGVDFESPAWNEKMEEVFNEELMARLNFYKDVFSAVPLDIDVFIGKFTGYDNCHELGFFIPYGKTELDTLKLFNAVNAVVTDSLEDIEEDIKLITDEEMFRRFITNTAEFSEYAKKLFGVKDDTAFESENKQRFILVDKETQSMLYLCLDNSITSDNIIADMVKVLEIIIKIKQKAHKANVEYNFNEIVSWALGEKFNRIFQIESNSVSFPKKYSMTIEKGNILAINIE